VTRESRLRVVETEHVEVLHKKTEDRLDWPSFRNQGERDALKEEA
jgi:hypothetical protein